MRKGLIAIMLVLASITAFAQRQNANVTPEDRAKRQTATLTENLKLTEDQQKQIYTLNLDRAKKMQEARDSQNQDRSKMKESMEKFNTDLTKVLTPEQQEKYTKMMAERRSRSNRSGGPRK